LIIEGEYHHVFEFTSIEGNLEKRSGITTAMDAAYLHERIHFIQDFSTVYKP